MEVDSDMRCTQSQTVKDLAEKLLLMLMNLTLKMRLPLLQRTLELDQEDWPEQDAVMSSNTELSTEDAWIAQRA